MNVPALRLVIGATLSALALLAYAPRANACACCADPGERIESTRKLDAYERGELEKLLFAKRARLYMNAAGTAGVRGISDPADAYALTQTRTGDRWTFTLKDPKGKTGTVAFTLPSTIESFFVDTREQKTGDPLLYKEWRLSAPLATTGVFASASASGAPTIRVVLQGRGNVCTSADQFTSYTLIVSGPSATFTLFGALTAP